jgi:hypothetical protein
MTEFDLYQDGLFISCDDVSRSAPWRLMDYGDAGALTDEQVQEISLRFDLDREILEALSRHLAFLLNPSQHPLVIHMSRKIATERATKELERALADTISATRKLKQAAERLRTLYTGPYKTEGAGYRLERLKLSIGQAQRQADDASKELQALVSMPNAAIVVANSKKGPVTDLRRKSVTHSIFYQWKLSGRKLTYTTDSLTSERRGPLIDFANAVVVCITDPPTKLPAETIVSDVRAMRVPKKPLRTDFDDQNMDDQSK